jgi:hypothetical protein
VIRKAATADVLLAALSSYKAPASCQCREITKRWRGAPDVCERMLKARYAVESFSSVYQGKKLAKRCKRVLSPLMQLQNYLGGINDIVTRKALFVDIREHPTRGLTAEQNRHRAFAAGLIIGSQQAQIHQLLDRARKAHSRFENAKAFWKLPHRRSAVAPLQLPSAEKQNVSVAGEKDLSWYG